MTNRSAGETPDTEGRRRPNEFFELEHNMCGGKLEYDEDRQVTYWVEPRTHKHYDFVNGYIRTGENQFENLNHKRAKHREWHGYIEEPPNFWVHSQTGQKFLESNGFIESAPNRFTNPRVGKTIRLSEHTKQLWLRSKPDGKTTDLVAGAIWRSPGRNPSQRIARAIP